MEPQKFGPFICVGGECNRQELFLELGHGRVDPARRGVGAFVPPPKVVLQSPIGPRVYVSDFFESKEDGVEHKAYFYRPEGLAPHKAVELLLAGYYDDSAGLGRQRAKLVDERASK